MARTPITHFKCPVGVMLPERTTVKTMGSDVYTNLAQASRNLTRVYGEGTNDQVIGPQIEEGTYGFELECPTDGIRPISGLYCLPSDTIHIGPDHTPTELILQADFTTDEARGVMKSLFPNRGWDTLQFSDPVKSKDGFDRTMSMWTITPRS